MNKETKPAKCRDCTYQEDAAIHDDIPGDHYRGDCGGCSADGDEHHPFVPITDTVSEPTTMPERCEELANVLDGERAYAQSRGDAYLAPLGAIAVLYDTSDEIAAALRELAEMKLQRASLASTILMCGDCREVSEQWQGQGQGCCAAHAVALLRHIFAEKSGATS